MSVLEPGQIIHGKYRVLRVLGRGGMGYVLAARHLHLDESVAIKMLHPESIARADAVARFVREARMTMKLKSEHVVRIFDVDLMNGSTPYMVMELLEGSDLAAVIEKGTGSARRVEVVVGWVLQACEGLAEAHALGIVHRDLKPANLFLTRRPDGSPHVKVLDFGVSKLSAPASKTTTKPRRKISGVRIRAVSQRESKLTNGVLGSPQYMAPEQIASPDAADPRTDIWALGVILYQALTGSAPFSASHPAELARKIETSAPTKPRALRPSIPTGLEAVVLRCLRKSVDARYDDVAALAEALVPFGGDEAAASALRTARTIRGREPSILQPHPPLQATRPSDGSLLASRGSCSPPAKKKSSRT